MVFRTLKRDDNMRYRNIGQTEISTSSVILGIMRMNMMSVKDATKTLEAAYDTGINYIDSADIYGNGDSDRVFKSALQQAQIRRDKLFIQSKAGIILDPNRSHGNYVFGKRYDLSKKHILSAVDGILQRMGIDYLDSFLLHRPDALMRPEEISAAFDELQMSGKVRFFGVSNFNPEQVKLVKKYVKQPLLINQLQFGIMHSGMIDEGLHVNMNDERSIMHDGGLLEYSRRTGMTIQTWSPFQYGYFSGTFIDNDKFMDLNKILEKISKKYQVSKNAIATAWILRHPANMQVVLGTMNPQHIIDSANGSDICLTEDEWYDVYFAAGNDLP